MVTEMTVMKTAIIKLNRLKDSIRTLVGTGEMFKGKVARDF
jgi:hypothetical protein